MRSFHIVGHMEGNSCWSKPILETHVFSKGRAGFHHNKVAGTGQAPPDSNAEMVQQVSAENQLLVLGRLLGIQETLEPGGLSGWQDSAIKSRDVPVWVGCRWIDGDH